MKRPIAKWLLGFALFTAVGVVFGLQFYFSGIQQGNTSPAILHIYDQLCYWYTWGILFLLIIWIARKFPLTPEHRLKNLVFQATTGFILAYIHAAMYISAYYFLDQLYSGEPFSFEPVVNGFFRLNMPMRIINCYLLFAGINAYDFYQKYHERTVKTSQLETELAVAKVQMMKMQLHPHFLFNTLHTIAGLVRVGEKQQAVTMIAGLSDLLRTAMEKGSEQTITLAQELEFVKRYLAIEQVRFSDRLIVKMDIDPATLDDIVPNLLLQPLVENAIIHGISSKPEGGIIELSARRDNGALEINIRDNGSGLPPGWNIRSDKGIGLKNTQNRLVHLYGKDQQFLIENKVGGGVSVTIRVPLLFDKS